MSRKCRAVFWFVVSVSVCFSTPPGHSAQSNDEAAVRALVEKFVAACVKKDLDGIVALWSAKSPDYDEVRSKRTVYTFGGDIRVTFVKVKLEGDKAQVTLKKVDAKSGKPSNPIIELVKDNGGWKIWRVVVMEQELADALKQVRTKEERARLMRSRKDLVTTNLVKVLAIDSQTQAQQDKFDEAQRLHDIALEVAETLKDKASRGLCHLIQGIIVSNQSQLSESLEHFQRALPLLREGKDKDNEAQALTIIGKVYTAMGQHGKAIEAAEASLKVWRELGNKTQEMETLHSIGHMYEKQKKPALALNVWEEWLKRAEGANDRRATAEALMDIGGVKYKAGKHEEALKAFEASLKISRELKAKPLETKSLMFIGSLLSETKKYGEAMEAAQASLKIAQEVGDRDTEAKALNTIAHSCPN